MSEVCLRTEKFKENKPKIVKNLLIRSKLHDENVKCLG